MPPRTYAQRLLGGILPLEKIGPSLRRAARRALAGGDPQRARQVAVAVVRELARRGDLVRVAVESGRPGRQLFLLRGETGLIDLEPLLGTDGAAADLLPAPGVLNPANADAEFGAPSLARMLQALSNDRSLPLGQPLSTHPQVVLEGILELLERAVPQLRLAVVLAEAADLQVPPRRVLGSDALSPLPLWSRHRQPGNALWFAAGTELPPPLARVLAAPGGATLVAGVVGVPLAAPPELAAQEGETGPEAGLLFVTAGPLVGRAALLADGRQLARFVTARWRQHLGLARLVHADGLTGVHNRAYFDGHFGLEVERARRHESPLSLVLADIDHFKQVNDTWGHPVGDQVLRSVAREMQGVLRRIDLICRVGGEEFALILPATPAGAAQEVCQRLLERFESLRVNVAEVTDPLRVTLSFGGVTFPEGGTEPAELYRKADGMLYLAKHQGRDRCMFWRPLEEPLLILPPAC